MSRPEQERYRQRLQVLREARPPSNEQGLDHCNECGLCCIVSPCKLKGIRDLKRLARRLGESPKHVARAHLAVIRAPTGFEVRMRRRDEADPLSPCGFMTDAFRCRVHDAKPSGGREFMCWDTQTHVLRYEWDEHELAKLHKLTK